MLVIILITIAASFAAGYTARRLLAVALERKRQRQPLSGLSDELLIGFADFADHRATITAGEAGRTLLAELNRRHFPSGPPTITAQPGRGNPQHDVWVVAQVRSWGDDGMPLDWELGGVFSAPEKADRACRRPGDGYWRVEIDAFLGEKTAPAPAVFPRR